MPNAHSSSFRTRGALRRIAAATARGGLAARALLCLCIVFAAAQPARADLRTDFAAQVQLVFDADLAVDLAEQALRKAIVLDGNTKGQFTQAATDHVRAVTDHISAWEYHTPDSDFRAGLVRLDASAAVIAAAEHLVLTRRRLQNRRDELAAMTDLVRTNALRMPPHVSRVQARAGETLVYDFKWNDVDEDINKKLDFYMGLIEQALDAMGRHNENLNQANAALPEAALTAERSANAINTAINNAVAYQIMVEAGVMATEILLDARQIGPWSFVYHAAKEGAQYLIFPGPTGALPDSFYTDGGPIDPSWKFDEAVSNFGTNLIEETKKNAVGQVVKLALRTFIPGMAGAANTAYLAVESQVVGQPVNFTFQGAKTRLYGGIGRIFTVRNAAKAAVKIVAKSALGAAMEEETRIYIETSDEFEAYLKARITYEFTYRSGLIYTYGKQIAREILRAASVELLTAVASLDQNGWARLPDPENQTAPWSGEVGQLELIVTFGRAVQDVRVMEGAAGEALRAIPGQITPETGGCQCVWRAQLTGPSSLTLQISASSTIQGPGLDVSQFPGAPNTQYYQGIDANPATVAHATYGFAPVAGAEDRFALLDWQELDQTPTNRFSDGGVDTNHKIVFGPATERFVIADWATLAEMRAHYDAVIGPSGAAAYAVTTGTGIIVDELVLPCALSDCSSERKDTLVSRESVTKGWKRTLTVPDLGAMDVWAAEYLMEPPQNTPGQGVPPSVWLRVWQFETTAASIKHWENDPPDSSWEEVTLGRYDTAWFRNNTAPARRDIGRSRVEFRGRVGAFRVEATITAPAADDALRRQILALASGAAAPRGAQTPGAGAEASPAASPGAPEVPEVPGGGGPGGPQVGVNVPEGPGGGPAGPEIGAGEPPVPPVVVLEPPNLPQQPGGGPAPVQLVVLQSFPAMPILSRDGAANAVPDQPLDYFQVFADREAETHWTPAEDWVSQQGLAESAMMSARDQSDCGISYLIGQLEVADWTGHPLAQRPIRTEQATFAIRYAGTSDRLPVDAFLFVKSYEIGAGIVSSVLSDPAFALPPGHTAVPAPGAGQYDVSRSSVACEAGACAQFLFNGALGNTIYSLSITPATTVPREVLDRLATQLLGQIHPSVPAAAGGQVANLPGGSPGGPGAGPLPGGIPGGPGAGAAAEDLRAKSTDPVGPGDLAPYLSRVRVRDSSGVVYDAEWVETGDARELAIRISKPLDGADTLRLELVFSAPVSAPWMGTGHGPVALADQDAGVVYSAQLSAAGLGGTWPDPLQLQIAAYDRFSRGIDADPATIPKPTGNAPLAADAVRMFSAMEAGRDQSHALGIPVFAAESAPGAFATDAIFSLADAQGYRDGLREFRVTAAEAGEAVWTAEGGWNDPRAAAGVLMSFNTQDPGVLYGVVGADEFVAVPAPADLSAQAVVIQMKWEDAPGVREMSVRISLRVYGLEADTVTAAIRAGLPLPPGWSVGNLPGLERAGVSLAARCDELLCDAISVNSAVQNSAIALLVELPDREQFGSLYGTALRFQRIVADNLFGRVLFGSLAGTAPAPLEQLNPFDPSLQGQVRFAAARAGVPEALLIEIYEETGIPPYEFLAVLQIPPNMPAAQWRQATAEMPAEEAAKLRRAIVIAAGELGDRLPDWLVAWARGN